MPRVLLCSVLWCVLLHRGLAVPVNLYKDMTLEVGSLNIYRRIKEFNPLSCNTNNNQGLKAIKFRILQRAHWKIPPFKEMSRKWLLCQKFERLNNFRVNFGQKHSILLHFLHRMFIHGWEGILHVKTCVLLGVGEAQLLMVAKPCIKASVSHFYIKN